MKVDFIIKFGGSAVTVKNQLETIKDGCLSHACSIVKYLIEQGRTLIIVHGAGSFGHHQAKQYNVTSGFKHLLGDDQDKVKYGFCATRISVTKLNHMIVERLFQHGVNAVGIPAIGSWSTDNREVIQHNTDTIMAVLNNGLVPVLHGDCVLDQSKGCVILSGDTIIQLINILKFGRVSILINSSAMEAGKVSRFALNVIVNNKGPLKTERSKSQGRFVTCKQYRHRMEYGRVIVETFFLLDFRNTKTLCKVLEVQEVVFLTDVDGIFNKSPSNMDAILIPEVTVDSSGYLSRPIKTEDSKFDVTGGIELKLKTAKNIVLDSKGRTSVWICNVTCTPSSVLVKTSRCNGTHVKLCKT